MDSSFNILGLFMDNFWMNFALEIGLLSFLGVLYYFYQKRKIIHYEENKVELVMGFILQSCLAEKKDDLQQSLDQVIESLDDFIQHKTSSPPTALLKTYAQSAECTIELKNVILEGLKEIEQQ